MIRLSFIFWICTLSISLYTYGVLYTLLYLLLLHIVILRLVPYHIFGLEPATYSALGLIAFAKSVCSDQAFIWNCLDMQSGFTEESFKYWVEKKVKT